MKMFLIRHGESMQNTKENYEIGLPDHKIYLTEKGKEEALKAGEFLLSYIHDNNIDLSNSVMWVSPYTRTRETASIINGIIKVKNVKEDITLIEQQYGLFSDKEKYVQRMMFPNQYSLVENYCQNDGKFYVKMPQGESAFDVALRTREFLNSIARDKEDVLFIVSHGTALKTLVMNYFHYPPEWYNKELTPANCSIKLISDDGEEKREEYIYNPPKPKTYQLKR